MAVRRGLFNGSPKSSRLAKIIKIDSPTAFKKSVRILKRGGLSTKEKRALVFAQNRAGAQLKRKNLSSQERRQFKAIIRVKLPRLTKNK